MRRIYLSLQLPHLKMSTCDTNFVQMYVEFGISITSVIHKLEQGGQDGVSMRDRDSSRLTTLGT